MNVPPDEQEAEKVIPEEPSSEFTPSLSDEESLNGFVQIYKKVKLMVVGDPITQNSSKQKNQELSSYINAQDAYLKPKQGEHEHDLEKLENERFSKSILSIWRTESESSYGKNKAPNEDKPSNVYHFKNGKKNEPR